MKIFVIVALAVVPLILLNVALWVSIHWDGWSPAVYERRHNIVYYKGDLLGTRGSRAQTINSATELTHLMPQWQEIDRYDSAFFEERHNIIYNEGGTQEESKAVIITSVGVLTSHAPHWSRIDAYDYVFFEDSFLLFIHTWVNCSARYFRVTEVCTMNDNIKIEAVTRNYRDFVGFGQSAPRSAILQLDRGLAGREIVVNINEIIHENLIRPRTLVATVHY